MLGKIRTEVWQRYGSIAGVNVRSREIRDSWLKEKRDFGVLSTPWKETLRDAIDDIKACRESAKKRVRKSIRKHTSNEDEQKKLYTLLKQDKWPTNGFLRRMMRKHWRKGHNHTHDQIIVRSDDYRTFQHSGRAWVAIPGLERGKRVAIPLSTTVEPTGTLRILLRCGKVEIHYVIDAPYIENCGNRTIGVDKGYTEVLVDSDGDHHGANLGLLIRARSDRLELKNHRRRCLRKIAASSDPSKAARIRKNNLGNKKSKSRGYKEKQEIRNVIFKAVHKVVDKASTIAAEDLTGCFAKRRFNKNTNRRLNAWSKGVISEALDSVSRRRGSSVVLVNAAYTSQIDSRTGCLIGSRKGDLFYQENGDVLQADENAALNILARIYDSEISHYMPHQEVKRILQGRTERHRLGLLNLDTSQTCLGSERITFS